MKNAVLFLIIVLFSNLLPAQSPTYDDLWKKVENFEIDDLPEAALNAVENIVIQSRKDKNTTQIIKTLIYKSKFALVLHKDAQLKIINDFKSEIAKSQPPTKNILENLLANLYWQYFNENRYKFYRRTKTAQKVDTTDFRTWDLTTIFNEIHTHYQNSLHNGLILQLEPLNKYDAILTTEVNSKTYRPTLYDFLSHNALEFYKTNETHITKPSYKFEIDNPDFFSDGSTFSTLNISSKDSTSLQLHALKIYQNLIRFHTLDASPYPNVYNDIERLKFIKEHSILNDKEALLLKTLNKESERTKAYDFSSLYNFEIASIYYNQSKTYKPKTAETHRWKAKKAHELCTKVISEFPESSGAKKCKILKEEIEAKLLNLTTESYIPIKAPSRLLVRYKNLDFLQFKAYKLNEKQYKAFSKNYNQNEKWAFLNKLKPYTSWESKLRNENDFQIHTTEILVPQFENGRYVILATDKANTQDFYGITSIQITNLAVVENQNDSHKIFQVINRLNGAPINNTKVVVSEYSRGNIASTKEFMTNHLGQIKIKKTKKYYRSFSLKVNSNGDTAFFGNYWLGTNYKSTRTRKHYKGFLFTDRSIYRPGQTVYFKGIAIERDEEKSSVLTNTILKVKLRDANYQDVKTLEFTTNEFGSFHGEFVLPDNGLTGSYSLNISSKKIEIFGNAYVSVEEYKRPKFEAKFAPVKETFKINDSVTIKGNAIAFSGANITNAKVVYRIQRKVQFPKWYYWHRPYFNSEPQEITHGEGLTNDKGEFKITFKALPDNSITPSSLPIFNYEVTADVTDINGETRSATTLINVGYHTLLANLNMDSKLDKTKKDHAIGIDTKNLNGEFVPAKGTVKIYKLKAPKMVLRSRPWPEPDYQDISKEQFKNSFPHDAYKDENDPVNWEKGALVFDATFNTKDSKTLKLGRLKKWASGEYIVLLESKDKFGQTVKDETTITLFSEKDTTLADKQLFEITTNKTSYAIGEMAEITLASAANNVSVTVTIEKNQKIVDTKLIQLNNNKTSFRIPVTEEGLGGFAVHYSLAAFNSSKSGTLNVYVPYPETDLTIETTTFRDRLQPGANETWSFNVKGPQGDKVSAELLAGMYDASLDQFKPHNWNFTPIVQPLYRSSFNSNMHSSFSSKKFSIYNDYNSYFSYPTRNFDAFNWFGFSFINEKCVFNTYLNTLRNRHQPQFTSKYDSTVEKGFVVGTILDGNYKNEPLAYANILIKGTNRGTTSDFDGNFTIEAKKGDELVVSFLGYTNQTIKIDQHNSFKIPMSLGCHGGDMVIQANVKRLYNAELNAADVDFAYARGDSDNLALAIRSTPGVKIEKELNDVAYFVKEERYTSTDTIYDIDYYIRSKKAKAVENKKIFSNISIRKNLQETVFFFPNLRTDANGHVTFSFTTPEALTQWKLQLLAHTKNLESATKTMTTVTQKELMVIPNAPRFLREGDSITISSKIANLTDKQLSGQAALILTNAISGKKITKKLVVDSNRNSNKGTSTPLSAQQFEINANGNTQVSWHLSIPENVQAVQYKVVAKTADFSDGEQNALPVLSNRLLVTETLPMWIKGKSTKTFSLDKLKNTTSTSLKHHKLTLEMTSNPAWYAVQALPYLMEYPYECNEQTFSRYYANALASHIANSNPRIQEVFNQWKNADVLISNLEKNEELKSILIQETPWLRDAQSETEQKKRIALLFDLNKMNNELQLALRKLKQNQMASGGWSWFKGGRENRWITQHIITGFGHLSKLGVTLSEVEGSQSQMIKNAIKYLDIAFIKEYKNLKKYNKSIDLSADHLSYTQLHYLYMRSFFPKIKQSKEVKDISNYYHKQIKNYWQKRSLYAKGLMVLITHRNNDSETSGKILRSLKENSITSEELGMYWKSNTNSWFWYQAPIETQVLLIEAFSEAGTAIFNEEKHLEIVDNLKIWLLKNKQTNKWKTTKATSDAIYALLLQGSDWLSVTEMVDVTIGGQKIDPSKLENVNIEAGTGYYKTSWNNSEITPEMGEVKLEKHNAGIAWGGLYWQYFEDLDKITAAETPLKISKQLFLKQHTDTGDVLTGITPETILNVGDLVTVRIELRSDRPMEYVHMKDMRASSLEPINVLSRYKWQDGLGYYESTKDASTNFFFDYVPKGVYVFEYDLRVNNAGSMSNGITTIQSMYAPEFSSHSKGIRVTVKQ